MPAPKRLARQITLGLEAHQFASIAAESRLDGLSLGAVVRRRLNRLVQVDRYLWREEDRRRDSEAVARQEMTLEAWLQRHGPACYAEDSERVA